LTFRHVWPRVVEAIEQAMPLYDEVNEAISLGRADLARRYGVEKSGIRRGGRLLDSGIGPGSLSKTLLSHARPRHLVGLDFSASLLRQAKRRLEEFGERLSLVRGTFEKMPFRPRAFDGIFSAYAFRDALDKGSALLEYARVARPGSPLVIVDIGKPSNPLKRFLMGVYIQFIMPIIAKIAIRGRLRCNPWQMIVPTYKNLPTTSEIQEMIRRSYGPVYLREFLQGGIAVMIATRRGALRRRAAKRSAIRRLRRGGRARGR